MAFPRPRSSRKQNDGSQVCNSEERISTCRSLGKAGARKQEIAQEISSGLSVWVKLRSFVNERRVSESAGTKRREPLLPGRLKSSRLDYFIGVGHFHIRFHQCWRDVR